jgi:hypothetical protein
MTGIDPIQAKINRQLGISDETFLRYNATPQGKTLASPRVGPDPVQLAIHYQTGIGPTIPLRRSVAPQSEKWAPPPPVWLADHSQCLLDPVQQAVNRQIGISDKAFLQYVHAA